MNGDPTGESRKEGEPVPGAPGPEQGAAAPKPQPAGAVPAPQPAGPAQPGAAQPPEPAAAQPPELVSIEDFAKIQLRIAKVIAAEPHPRADKLLKLQIELGSERRQLVAGIAPWYRPEDLVGKLIVVVANLKPAKLRGELSEGMLLAASDGDVVSLLGPDRDLPPGAGVR